MSVKSVFSNKPKLNTLSYALISLFSILFLAILIFTIFSFLKQPKKAVLGVRVSVSEQDAIPHPDFKDKNFYACVIGNLNEEKINNKTDRTFNHLATTEELTSLKELDCGLSVSAPQSQKITDATGLDKLPNLTYLDLFNNKLTAIDVSKNVALRGLDLSGNQLAIIDISKNIVLEGLNAPDNKLTAIDVSKNIALEFLGLFENQLTTIDISGNMNLTGLDLNFNQLNTIKGLNKTDKINYLDISYNATKIFFTTTNPRNKEDKLAMTDKYIFLNAGYKFNSIGLPLSKIRYALHYLLYDTNIAKLTTIFTDINNNQLSSDSLIKNGDRIQVDKDNKPYGAQFIVLGDTTGDGKVQSNDVIKAYRYYKQSQQDPNSLDFLSADVTHDGKVQSNDVIKIYRYYKGTLDSLW